MEGGLRNYNVSKRLIDNLKLCCSRASMSWWRVRYTGARTMRSCAQCLPVGGGWRSKWKWVGVPCCEGRLFSQLQIPLDRIVSILEVDGQLHVPIDVDVVAPACGDGWQSGRNMMGQITKGMDYSGQTLQNCRDEQHRTHSDRPSRRCIHFDSLF